MNTLPREGWLGRRTLLLGATALVPLAMAGCSQTPTQILTDLSNIQVSLMNALNGLPAGAVPAAILAKLQWVAENVGAAVTKVQGGTLPSGTAVQQTFGWIMLALTVAAGVVLPPGAPVALVAAWSTIGMVLNAARIVLPQLASLLGVALPVGASAGPVARYTASLPSFPNVAAAQAYLAGMAAAK